jgi:hypothetical protein
MISKSHFFGYGETYLSYFTGCSPRHHGLVLQFTQTISASALPTAPFRVFIDLSHIKDHLHEEIAKKETKE